MLGGGRVKEDTVRLRPSGMFKYAFHKIAQAVESKDTAISVLEPADSNDVVVARFDLKDRSIVLLSPAPDTEELDIAVNVGVKPLPRVLARVRLLQQQDVEEKRVDVTYIIPLAESHKRQHWTTLVIKGDRCEFYDPRWQYPRVAQVVKKQYSLEPLKKILGSANPPFEFVELGLNSFLKMQEILNDTHCGHYIGWFIGKLASAIKAGESIWTMLGREQKQVPKVAELNQDYEKSDNSPAFQQHIKGNSKICSALGFSTKADELSDEQLADAEFNEGNALEGEDQPIHRSESAPRLGEVGGDDEGDQSPSPDSTPPRRPRRNSPPPPPSFWARNAQTIFWCAVAGAIVGLFLLSVVFPPAGGASGLLYSAAASCGAFAGGSVAAASSAINETCCVVDSAVVEKTFRSTAAKLAKNNVANLDRNAHLHSPAEAQSDRRPCTRSLSVSELDLSWAARRSEQLGTPRRSMYGSSKL